MIQDSKNIIVIGKHHTQSPFNPEKIKTAVSKSAARINQKLSNKEKETIVTTVLSMIQELPSNEVYVQQLHTFVEMALSQINQQVAKSYRDFRNYKQETHKMFDRVFEDIERITYIGDKENANMDSSLTSTKKSLAYNVLNRELYKRTFLNIEEIQAIEDGYIYIHDMGARRDTMNCCLFDVATVLEGGFEMGNLFYNEPKSLDTAFDVLGDIIMTAASQQYGGFTVPRVDHILEKYAKKTFDSTYKRMINKYMTAFDISGLKQCLTEDIHLLASHDAMEEVQRQCRQGYQGIEYKLNTVASGRGDYPFVTFTFGLETGVFGRLISKTILDVHRIGQGAPGHKRAVLFPKLVFLFDKELHGIGKELEDVYKAAVQCSSTTMYPKQLGLHIAIYVE